MNAQATVTAPLERIAAWFRREGADPQASAGQRWTPRRSRYDRIGAFLFEHDLDISAANYDFAGRFLAGADAALVQAVADTSAAHGTLTDRDVERIDAQCAPQEPAVDTLGPLIRELEGRVADCLAAVGDSATTNTAYSSALDLAVKEQESDPAETYRRLLEMTLEVSETTRKIAGRLARTHRDIRKLRADLDRAVREAAEDHLTGLPNRRGFFAALEKAVASKRQGTFTLALCDIDDFKSINDTHGHETGDRVLQFFAALLRDRLSHALVARYGGEEFVCLFEGVTVDVAAAMLNDVRQHLSGRSLRDQTTRLPIKPFTFSAGVAAVEGDSQAALRASDDMLYVAKKRGKDQVLIAPEAGPIRRDRDAA